MCAVLESCFDSWEQSGPRGKFRKLHSFLFLIWSNDIWNGSRPSDCHKLSNDDIQCWCCCCCWFIGWFIRWFVHSFIEPFTDSLIDSFIHSLTDRPTDPSVARSIDRCALPCGLRIKAGEPLYINKSTQQTPPKRHWVLDTALERRAKFSTADKTNRARSNELRPALPGESGPWSCDQIQLRE